jgi:hypothetical protein
MWCTLFRLPRRRWPVPLSAKSCGGGGGGGAHYTNPPITPVGQPPAKRRQKMDHSRSRQDWIEVCTAAVPCRNPGSNTIQEQLYARGRPGGLEHGRRKPDLRSYISHKRGGRPAIGYSHSRGRKADLID